MTRLSNRQYPLMRVFAMEPMGFHMTVEDAGTFDQRPFRSMLIQKWVAYKPGKGFFLTHEGRDAWREFNNTSIFRLHPEAPLTAYFDPVAYGLPTAKKRARRKAPGAAQPPLASMRQMAAHA
jgi:hypothetical protein